MTRLTLSPNTAVGENYMYVGEEMKYLQGVICSSVNVKVTKMVMFFARDPSQIPSDASSFSRFPQNMACSGDGSVSLVLEESVQRMRPCPLNEVRILLFCWVDLILNQSLPKLSPGTSSLSPSIRSTPPSSLLQSGRHEWI